MTIKQTYHDRCSKLLQRKPPHTDELHVPLEIIYTHDIVRCREYQFPSCVIPFSGSCRTKLAKRWNLILIPSEIEYGKRLMNVCMEMVCACCVLSRIKTLERVRLMMAKCEPEWIGKLRQQMQSRTLKLPELLEVVTRKTFSRWDKRTSINQNLIGIKERFRNYENGITFSSDARDRNPDPLISSCEYRHGDKTNWGGEGKVFRCRREKGNFKFQFSSISTRNDLSFISRNRSPWEKWVDGCGALVIQRHHNQGFDWWII